MVDKCGKTHPAPAESSSDAVYAALDQKIMTLTARRNEIAGEMLEILEGAEFGGTHVVPWRAEQLIFEAERLLASVD